MVKVFDINQASLGIQDNSTKVSLIVEDDKITVKTASIDTIDRNLTVRGDVKVYGILDAGFVRTTEIITNQRYEKRYLEFAGPEGNGMGTGLTWLGGEHRRLFLLMDNPDRYWSTEHIDISQGKSLLINGEPVLSEESLGAGVTRSNLKKLGTLESLEVSGEVNIADHIFFNPISQRLSIGREEGNGLLTIYDFVNNVELIIDGDENGYGKMGTYSTKGLNLVTDNQTRITISENGNVTIGHEYRDSTITRVYGKMGVGVKNPREQFEVAGNMRMGNRLFANGDAPPPEGSYQKGDIVWNSNPRIGGYVGWICIATGAPGSWKPFGKIE